MYRTNGPTAPGSSGSHKPDGPLDRLADQCRDLCAALADQAEQLRQMTVATQVAADRVVRHHRIPRRDFVTISPTPYLVHPDDFRYVQIFCASGASLIVAWRGISFTLTTANGWNPLNVRDGAELSVATQGANFNAIVEYSDDKLP